MSTSIVLIVEDEKPIYTLLKEKLEKENFQVEIATDGEMGFKKALDLRPNLIMLDIILPKLDGMSMLKNLRKESAWGAKVPVILLTNVDPGSEKMNREITETQPAYYMVKSNWKLEDVMEKIKEVLQG